jgi:maleylacetate reductase
VVADPALMASAPGPQLVATGMNALAHAMEALYTPCANPVAELAALRAAALLGAELPRAGRGEGSAELALGAVLGGYAVGTTGLALHHAVCQAIVRTCGTPHAEANAVMLPHSARLMAGRAPREMGEFARSLRGQPVDPATAGDPAAAGDLLAALTALSGTTRLSQLGVTKSAMGEVASTAAQHPAVQATPGAGVDRDELRDLLRRAL